MKSIALIHTVKSVAMTFDQQLRDGVGEEVKIHNLLDDFLANNPNEIGMFSMDNRNRFLLDVKAAELTGADMIVTTCSTLTPIVEMVRPFVKVPIVAIDDAMAKKGVTYGDNIMILATAESTIQPSISKLKVEAGEINHNISISYRVCHEAFAALKAMDMKLHDSLLLELAKEVKGYDCIILAQASMEHLESSIGKITGCPVLSSPKLCIQQIHQMIKA